MINFLISHIKLSKRIYLGYYLVAGLTLVLIFIIYITFKSISTDFRSYIDFSKQSSQINHFISLLTEMERQALIYTYEGYESAGTQVSTHYHSMQKILRQNEPIDESILGTLQITKKHLDAYHAAFMQVKKQRELQKRLVRVELRNHASNAQSYIDELIGTTQNVVNRSNAIYYQMLTSLLLIEKNAYRYFDSLDSQYVNVASHNFHKTQLVINKIRYMGNLHLKQIDEIEKVLSLYRNNFFEAVQRTRGYLYLVNVVMSAEAFEILYQSKKLAAFVEKNSRQIEAQFVRNIDSVIGKLILASIILFMTISLLSFIIIRSISIPLNRLTNTFKYLSSGSLQAKIPHYELDDEIGALTRAADNFKYNSSELKESKLKLERSNEELEQFVYTVSHDLKSPIVTSMGFIGIIKNLAQQGKYEQAFDKLDKVIKANERMSQLINDLLELSRVGRVDMDKKMLDLNVLLEDFSSNQTIRLKKKGVVVIIKPSFPTIYANESRILQIFENILSNTIKYANNNGDSELIIGYKETKETWRIYCQDNGPGIEPEYHEKVFGLFYRLEANLDGTGVGLAVARKIMKFHDGNIWVESIPPKGATFWMEFPKIDEQTEGKVDAQIERKELL